MGWRGKSGRGRGHTGFQGWAPYVPVAERRLQAEDKVRDLAKKGEKVAPVVISGRAIATTFWGKAWCDNLESYMDFANRLPRGRNYVRNGSVIDLKVSPGKVNARVNGSSLYNVEISIKPVAAERWQGLIASCAGQIGSLVEILQGKIAKNVMETVTSREHGLFPSPQQISMKCSCPDWATMCKHVAAALYGVGSRIDSEPELLFVLRQVDHMDLVTKAPAPAALRGRTAASKMLAADDLGAMFGIELEAEEAPVKKAAAAPARRGKKAKAKTANVHGPGKKKAPARKKVKKKANLR